MEIFRAFGRLALSGVKEAQAGLKRFQEWGQNAAKSLQDLGKKTQEVGRTLTRVFTVALGAASAAFTFLSTKIATYARDLDASAKSMRATTAEVQRMKAAVEGIGADFATAAGAVSQLRDGIDEFILTGGGPLKVFFKDIAKDVGITAEAFRGLSGPEALQLYYDTMRAAAVSQEDLRLGIKAMGIDITDIVPLLENGGAEMKRLGDEAEAAGMIMSDQAAADAKAFGDQISQLKRELAGLGTQIAADMLPVAIQLAEVFRSEVVPWIRAAADVVRGILQWFADLDPATRAWIAGLIAVAAAVGPIIVVLGSLIGSLGTLIKVAALVAGALASLSGVALAGLAGTLAAVAVQVGLLWLAFEGVKLIWPMVQAAFSAVIDGASWLLSSLGDIFSGIPALVGTVVGYFGDMFTGVVGWFQKLPAAVWGYISDMASGVVSRVKNMVSGVIDSLKSLYRTVVGNSIIPDLARDVGKEVSGMADHSIGESKRMAAGMIDAMPDDATMFTASVLNGKGGGAGPVINDFRHAVFRDDRDMLNRMRLDGAEPNGI